MKMSGLYTTGQVAEILNLAPQTVSNLCDNGVIRHSISGSRDRIISREDLSEFLIKVLEINPPPESSGLDVISVVENEYYFSPKEAKVFLGGSEDTIRRRFDYGVGDEKLEGFRLPKGTKKGKGDRKISRSSLLRVMIKIRRYECLKSSDPGLLERYGFPVEE
jgi:excisionase family DNA binding protein